MNKKKQLRIWIVVSNIAFCDRNLVFCEKKVYENRKIVKQNLRISESYWNLQRSWDLYLQQTKDFSSSCKILFQQNSWIHCEISTRSE